MKIYNYILKAHLGPFIFALGTVVFLFLFQFIYKSIDQLLGKGLSIWIITKLISLNLAWMVTLAVPMAVLVATLMAFGSLSASNEITIMKASGLSLKRLMAPVLIASVILCYLMVRFNNDVLPEANHQARVLLSDISRTKPTLILEAGKFSDDIGGAKILVRKTHHNSNKLEGIFIYDYSNPAFRNLFTAENGDISFTSDFRNVIMNLEDGEIHQMSLTEPSRNYRKIEFDKHRIILDARSFGFQQSEGNVLTRGDRELSADAMNLVTDSLQAYINKSYNSLIESALRDVNRLASIKYIDTVFAKGKVPDSLAAPFSGDKPDKKVISPTVTGNTVYDSLFNVYIGAINKIKSIASQKMLNTQVERQIFSYDVEIYKKYSIPFACIIFAMIGAPLGYRVRKGGFGIAAGFSLLFFLLYWASLIGGEKLADRGLLSPFLGMWLANILLGVFGLYLMFKSS